MKVVGIYSPVGFFEIKGRHTKVYVILIEHFQYLEFGIELVCVFVNSPPPPLPTPPIPLSTSPTPYPLSLLTILFLFISPGPCPLSTMLVLAFSLLTIIFLLFGKEGDWDHGGPS